MDLREFTTEILKHLVEGANVAAIAYAREHGASVLQEKLDIQSGVNPAASPPEQVNKIQIKVAVNGSKDKVITITAYFSTEPAGQPGNMPAGSAEKGNES